MSEFTSRSKFRVQLISSDGNSERVFVQIGLDGLKFLNLSNERLMKSYELGHISRWQTRGSSLVVYTRTPVDLEENQLTLQSDEYTNREILDMLTCSCLQLAEILQSKQGNNAQETANDLHTLVASNGKKRNKLPAVDEVEYWHSPEKDGWMQLQGEHLRTWRKRWFVLKQGYLFRFMNSSVSESVKPRGIIDMSKIQDALPASSVTGRPNSIQLKTATGVSVCYICESETDMVLWLSMFQDSINRIIKRVAGVEDEAKPAAAAAHTANSDLLKQLERNLTLGGGGDGGGSGSRGRSNEPAMVNVVGYDTVDGGDSTSGDRNPGSSCAWARTGGDLGYGAAAGVPGTVDVSALSPDTMINYGGHIPAPTSAPSLYPPGPTYSSHPSYPHPAATPMYAQPPTASMPGMSYLSPPGPVVQGAYSPASAQLAGAAGGLSHGASSVLDAAPAQQRPSYPYLQQASAPLQASAPAPAAQSAWQTHYASDGRPYYHNLMTNTTQWEAPSGLA